MIIDCEQTSVMCSFNQGPLHQCENIFNRMFYDYYSRFQLITHSIILVGTLPLILNSDVNPPGNHSVRVVASSGVRRSVTYVISSTDQPTGKLEDT